METDDGTYLMTYTQYNRNTTRHGIATSCDLVNWQKHGFAFNEKVVAKINIDGGKFPGNKAGAIITRREGDRLIASRVNGRYGM